VSNAQKQWVNGEQPTANCQQSNAECGMMNEGWPGRKMAKREWIMNVVVPSRFQAHG
jgi:hypothetical protein